MGFRGGCGWKCGQEASLLAEGLAGDSKLCGTDGISLGTHLDIRLVQRQRITGRLTSQILRYTDQHDLREEPIPTRLQPFLLKIGGKEGRKLQYPMLAQTCADDHRHQPLGDPYFWPSKRSRKKNQLFPWHLVTDTYSQR